MENRPFRSKLIVNDLIWGQANWIGMSYEVNRLDMCPPTLGLIFANEDLGNSIFRRWRRKLGNDDEFNELRVSIIEGLPSGYMVIIGSGMDGEIARARSEGFDVNPRFYIGASSICRLQQPNSANLETFKSAFKKHGKFYLVPIFSDPRETKTNLQLSILKKEITFRHVKDIPADDVDGLVHNSSALSYSYFILDLDRGGITFFSRELFPDYLH